MKKRAVDVALAFVDRINSHDVAGLAALMTDDHRFVDGLGQEMRGQEQMKEGWRGYFAWFPDYSIRVDNALSDGNVSHCWGRPKAPTPRTGIGLRKIIGRFRRHGRR